MGSNFNGVVVKLTPRGFSNLLEEINDSNWVYSDSLVNGCKGRYVYWQGVYFTEVEDGN